MARIGVLIVDDSAVVRRVLQDVLGQDPDIEIIGTAMDPVFAMTKMRARWPDVIVLDVEMPRMDGVTFLRKLMAERPTPVVICSTLTTKGAAITMAALSAGAVAVVEKPTLGLKGFLESPSAGLRDAVKAAARANLRNLARPASPGAARRPAASPPRAPGAPATPTRATVATEALRTTDRVVAIGASTGGTQALEVVLTALPRDCPGIAVVQHMPENFTAAFAERLDAACLISVREACHGDRLLPGRALIAPGGRHLRVRRSGAYYYAEVIDGPPVSRHRPSVDVLFRSTARAVGPSALGIIMTGMGSDGAAGMRDMRQAGAQTLAQDEASCVVFGMPKEAIRVGAAQHIVTLDDIADCIVDFGRSATAAA